MAVLEAYRAYTRPLPGAGRREAPRPSLQYQARQRERMRELGLLPEAPPSPLEVAREQEERGAREREAAEEAQIRAEERAREAAREEREDEREWQREVADRKAGAALDLARTKTTQAAATRRRIAGEAPEPPKLPGAAPAAQAPPRPPGLPPAGPPPATEGDWLLGEAPAQPGFRPLPGEVAPGVPTAPPPTELELGVPELPPATVWDQQRAELLRVYKAGGFPSYKQYIDEVQEVNAAERKALVTQEEARQEEELAGRRASLWGERPGVTEEEAQLRGLEGLPPLPEAPAGIDAAVRAYSSLGYTQEQAEALAAAERPVPTRPLPTEVPFEREAWETEEMARRRGAGLRRGLGRKPALPPPQLPGQAPPAELIPDDLKRMYPTYEPAQKKALVKALRDQGQAELAAALEVWMPPE